MQQIEIWQFLSKPKSMCVLFSVVPKTKMGVPNVKWHWNVNIYTETYLFLGHNPSTILFLLLKRILSVNLK